jgi:DNA end-binding protein Ku
MLHTMYYQEEVREAPDFGAEHARLKEGEMKVAHQLIEALAAKWDPSKYHDTFEENVKKLDQGPYGREKDCCSGKTQGVRRAHGPDGRAEEKPG